MSIFLDIAVLYVRRPVRGQGIQEGGGQQVVAPMMCRPLELGVELEELLHYHAARRSVLHGAPRSIGEILKGSSRRGQPMRNVDAAVLATGTASASCFTYRVQ
eukprot:6212839-Pleurochrysis_carterae.AAC.5